MKTPRTYYKIITFINILVSKLTIKQYIYTGKYLYQMKNCKLSVETLKNVLIEKIRIQKLLLLKNCRYDEYNRFWQTFYDKL